MAAPQIVAAKRLKAIRALDAESRRVAEELKIEPPAKPVKSRDPQNAYVKQLESLVDFMRSVGDELSAPPIPEVASSEPVGAPYQMAPGEAAKVILKHSGETTVRPEIVLDTQPTVEDFDEKIEQLEKGQAGNPAAVEEIQQAADVLRRHYGFTKGEARGEGEVADVDESGEDEDESESEESEPEFAGHPLSFYDGMSDEDIVAIKGIGDGTLHKIVKAREERDAAAKKKSK